MRRPTPKRGKLLHLPAPRETAAGERAYQTAATVRTQLSLLQGYADIMDGVSPQLKMQILSVMAEKTRELGTTLYPLLQFSAQRRPPIHEFRPVRDRTRELISDYRVLLERLHQTVSEAHGHAAGEPRLAKM